ncbi:ABC transporter ATP-binding protein [Actinomyces trachealis]|uniref:ABC transporter ATP-binding protein n=1 Tax=Actinomyces trachealis TaxID=2763540 RepID=UPI0018C52C63|nr:ABC transporter ATP-binding protein [Actinomyces trachealis]
MWNGPVLKASSISKSYGSRAALLAYSVTIGPGEVHGLLGPNGSGKSTCLHIIAGLIGADSGSVEICGQDGTQKQSRRWYGFAPDDLPLPAALTGREYLSFHDAMRDRYDREAASVYAEALHIDQDLDRPVAEYSHGMRRKVQLIAALSHNPRLLILDEPFRGLDPESSAVLQHIIQSRAAAGMAVLVATHDMLRAERDCHRISVLARGRTVACGTPEEISSKYSPEHIFEDAVLTVSGVDARLRKDCEKLTSLIKADL